jgi:transcriptional regulator with XRE-family HTH domain
VSDTDLGTFLRSRRELLTPAAAGLPAGRRRRTPGLRRAELATLAGISVEYLARLEQGRDRNPSSQVVNALADALRLSFDDRLALRRIAKALSGMTCLVYEPPATAVRPGIRMVLDRLEPAAALVVNRLSDVLAYTDGFARLAEPLGLLDRKPPNLTRYLFTDPRARDAYPDWDGMANGAAAALQLAQTGGDPHVDVLVREVPGLAERMATPISCAGADGIVRLRHPDRGEVRIREENLGLTDADDLQLVVYLPADDESAARLDRVLRRGPLRSISTGAV